MDMDHLKMSLMSFIFCLGQSSTSSDDGSEAGLGGEGEEAEVLNDDEALKVGLSPICVIYNLYTVQQPLDYAHVCALIFCKLI